MGSGHLPRQFRKTIFCFVVCWAFVFVAGFTTICQFFNEIVAYQLIIICVLTIRATQFLADLFADIARLIFSNFTGIVTSRSAVKRFTDLANPAALISQDVGNANYFIVRYPC